MSIIWVLFDTCQGMTRLLLLALISQTSSNANIATEAFFIKECTCLGQQMVRVPEFVSK